MTRRSTASHDDEQPLPLRLLFAPLTLPLVCWQSKSFRRASRCGEARARRRKEGRRASQHEACAAMASLLLPSAATGVSLRAVWCLSGATPRGQPWTSAVTCPQGRNGLNARRRAVLSTLRAPSLGRHVPRALWRSVWLDVTPIISAIACHQSNDVERYRRCRAAFLFRGNVTSSELDFIHLSESLNL